MKDVSTKRLGAELKRLRLAHGYKQVNVAVAVDITQPSYSHFESGKAKPSMGTLYKLAAYYSLTIDDILKRCIDLDNEIFFNPQETDKNKEEDDFLSFIHNKKILRSRPLGTRAAVSF